MVRFGYGFYTSKPNRRRLFDNVFTVTHLRLWRLFFPVHARKFIIYVAVHVVCLQQYTFINNLIIINNLERDMFITVHI